MKLDEVRDFNENLKAKIDQKDIRMEALEKQVG